MNSIAEKILVIVALGMSGSALACDVGLGSLSAEAKPQPAEVFGGISHFMLISAIFDKLGPAVRDVGTEERHVFEWPVEDGRTFFVVVGESCGKPYDVGYR